MKIRHDLAPETYFRAMEIAIKLLPSGTDLDAVMACAETIVARMFPEPIDRPNVQSRLAKYNFLDDKMETTGWAK